MTNKKSTKRALLMSALSMLLCVSMLIGSTFAWFTDSVTSGVNKIIAGNLDIEVYYAYPSDVVNGDIPASAWKKMEADKPVFNPDALWEPGYTEVVFFKFANEGSLELQYQLNVDILKETPGTNVMGEEFLLSNHIMAYINNTFEWNYRPALSTNREDATNPAGAPNPYYDTLNNAANYAPCRADNYEENPLSLDSWQTLHVNENTYATMVLWMPTTVGNEANHKTGTDAPQIDLGISVVATQYTHEKDSFDNQYDKDAFVYASTADEIASAVRNAKDGDTVYIKSGSYVLTSAQNLYIENKSINVVGLGRVDLEWKSATTSHLVYVHNTADEAMTVNLKNLHLDGKKLHATKGAGFWVRSDGGDITVNIEDCSSKDFGYDEVQIDNSYSDGAKIVVNLTNVTAQAACMNAIATTRSDINLFGACNIGKVTKQTWSNFVVENMYINGDNGVTKVVGVTTADELTAAVANAADGDTIMLLNDITGTAVALQKKNVDVVIDGNGNKFDGTIRINGSRQLDNTETLIIQNVKFVADAKCDFIDCNEVTTNFGYAHNVTIKKCSFTGTGNEDVVALRLRQTRNITVEDCTATGLHSLLWSAGTDGVNVIDVAVENCKNGVSVEGTTKVTLKDSTIETTGAEGYGIRVQANAESTTKISGCTFEAAVPVLLRKASGTYALAIEGENTFTATNTDGYQIVITDSDFGAGKTLTAPSGNATVTGTESFVVYNG